MNSSTIRAVGAALALLVASTVAPVLDVTAARATFQGSANGPIVFESSYSGPCTSGTCRHWTASHPGSSANLWVVDPTVVGSAGASTANDPAATRQLTDTEGNDASTAGSPDGTSVVFDRDTTGTAQIYTVSRNNAPAAEDDDPGLAAGATAADGARRISSDGSNDTSPSFSSDGHTIAFVQNLNAVVLLDLANPGSGERTVFGGSQSAVSDSRPVFDPVDQTQLVFVNGAGHLMLMTGVGSAAQTLHHPVRLERPHRWRRRVAGLGTRRQRHRLRLNPARDRLRDQPAAAVDDDPRSEWLRRDRVGESGVRQRLQQGDPDWVQGHAAGVLP